MCLGPQSQGNRPIHLLTEQPQYISMSSWEQGACPQNLCLVTRHWLIPFPHHLEVAFSSHLEDEKTETHYRRIIPLPLECVCFPALWHPSHESGRSKQLHVRP